VEARNPRPRYTVTRLAFLAKWAKRLLPDSLQDALLRKNSGITRDAAKN